MKLDVVAVVTVVLEEDVEEVEVFVLVRVVVSQTYS